MGPLAGAVVARLIDQLTHRSGEQAAPPSGPGATGPEATAPEATGPEATGPEAAAPAALQDQLTDQSLDQRPGHGPDPLTEPPSGAAPAAGAPGEAPTEADGFGARPADHPPAADRHTGWGGLLFLLPLVDELGLPHTVATDPERFGPHLRPVLHGLARRVAHRARPDDGPPAATDPAVLAFAGLPPGAAPPPAVPAPEHLDDVVDALTELLHARIAAGAPDSPTGADLLAAVCRRTAVIEADPGWIDVVLDLREVSVDVRRAGLDLDPGHLPWLGCVVRFRYV